MFGIFDSKEEKVAKKVFNEIYDAVTLFSNPTWLIEHHVSDEEAFWKTDEVNIDEVKELLAQKLDEVGLQIHYNSLGQFFTCSKNLDIDEEISSGASYHFSHS